MVVLGGGGGGSCERGTPVGYVRRPGRGMSHPLFSYRGTSIMRNSAPLNPKPYAGPSAGVRLQIRHADMGGTPRTLELRDLKYVF